MKIATTTTAPQPMRQALRHPLYRRLLAALAMSQAGDWLYNVALLAVVFDRTHSTTWLAVTTAARVVPIVVLGPLGGVLADRFDRRLVMVVSDAVRAVLMMLLALTAAWQLPVLLAPLLAAAATVVATPYPSCVAASVPRLVPAGDLAGANAARSAVGSLCIVAGPALGGALLLVASPTAAFVVNAVTFALSALVVLSLPAAALRVAGAEPGTVTEVPRVLTDLRAGLAALRSSGLAVRFVGADMVCSVVYGAQTVLLLLLSGSLGHGASGYGWLMAGIGLGGVLGTAVAARAADSRHPRAVLVTALLAIALSLPLVAVATSLTEAVVVSVLSGAGAIVVEVMTDTGLQRTLDERLFGRAYGFALSAAIGGIVAGSLTAPLLVDLLGLGGALLALGALVAGYALVIARTTSLQCVPAARAGQPGIGEPVPA